MRIPTRSNNLDNFYVFESTFCPILVRGFHKIGFLMNHLLRKTYSN